jgi:hypothetical protein
VITYLDASVILRRALGQPGPLKLEGVGATASSSLTRVECLRVIDRLRFQGEVDEAVQLDLRGVVFRALDTCSVIEVGPIVLDRASLPFPLPIKTLDAIHLASALILRENSEESVRFATHDRILAKASRAMGFEVLGPS